MSKGADSSSVVENEDEVGEFETDLTTKTTTDSTNRGRSGPEAGCQQVSMAERGKAELPGAVSQTRYNDAGAETGTTEEAGLEDGHNGETFGICEDIGRDDLVGTEGLFGVDEGREDLASLLTLA